ISVALRKIDAPANADLGDQLHSFRLRAISQSCCVACRSTDAAATNDTAGHKLTHLMPGMRRTEFTSCDRKRSQAPATPSHARFEGDGRQKFGADNPFAAG
ncbi:hypothetical protein, partial [Xanthomonas axonopodis]